MMMLIHRICMAFSGLGKFMSVAREMSANAAMLLQTSRGRQRDRLIKLQVHRVQTEDFLGGGVGSLTCSAGNGQSS